MKVYCQNFEKHDPDFHKPFKIFGVTLPNHYPQTILCEKREIIVDDPNPAYFCPVCKEYVDVSGPAYASWGPIESRAGWPKSMIRKM